MGTIVAVETAVPSYTVTREEGKEVARRLFADRFRDIDRLLAIFDHAEIEKRHFCVPLDWFTTPRTFKEKNEQYQHSAVELSVESAKAVLLAAGIAAKDIDAIVFVSSTGIATPSLDTRIAQILGMREDIARIPLWGLGCAGGASGLARADDYVQAHPEAIVLLVAVELCGLTFVHGDGSKSNLIGTALFSDGAASVIVVGEQRTQDSGQPFHGPRIVSSKSQLWPASEDVMGWDVRDEGLSVIFSRDIPSLVRKEMDDQISQLLDANQLTRHELTQFIAHPGGAKVLQAYQQALDLPPEWLDAARLVLREYGNMSSPTVLFVLRLVMAHLRHDASANHGYGVLAALGPGFSCEQVLLRFGS